MSFAPYEPPASRDARPAVILWYRVFAGFMTLLSLALFGVAIVTLRDAPLTALVTCVIAAALVALYGVATFVPFKPWGWTVGLIAIALGLASGVAMFAIPLLLFWFKPNVKAAFARL